MLSVSPSSFIIRQLTCNVALNNCGGVGICGGDGGGWLCRGVVMLLFYLNGSVASVLLLLLLLLLTIYLYLCIYLSIHLFVFLSIPDLSTCFICPSILCCVYR